MMNYVRLMKMLCRIFGLGVLSTMAGIAFLLRIPHAYTSRNTWEWIICAFLFLVMWIFGDAFQRHPITDEDREELVQCWLVLEAKEGR